MIKGKEIIFIFGIIVIIIISIFGGFILIPLTAIDIWPNLPFKNNFYLYLFLSILAIVAPFFAIASFLGFLWYQLFKNSLQPSMIKGSVKGKTKLLLYIVILAMLILLVFGLMGRKLVLQM